MTSIVFFGSSTYSVIILKALLDIKSFKISAVVTKKDKPVGRNQKILPNPVSQFALNSHLKLLQPDNFDERFFRQFQSLNPELALVVVYGPPYFSKDMINVPKHKVVNIHPSPLPKYRGATPGPWQIINGETISAVTFFQIDEKPDHGPIITQIPFPLSDNETAHSFYTKAFQFAADNLETVLKTYLRNPKALIPQDHNQKSYYPKFDKNTAQIDWSWEPEKIERFVRAMQPWPTAWTYVKNPQQQKLKMKILSGKITNGRFSPSTVQIEGKKPASWDQVQAHYTLTS